MQFAILAASSAVPPPQWNTVPGGVMQYYVSLPEQWRIGKRWTVVVAIESTNKEFEQTAGIRSSPRSSVIRSS